MHRPIWAAILIFFMYFAPQDSALCDADNQFDSIFNNLKKEKKLEWQNHDEVIDKKKLNIDLLWRSQKISIEKKWDRALSSTQKEWIHYSQDFNSLSHVNFSEGFVEVSATIPIKEENINNLAEKFIGHQIAEVFSKNNFSNENVLSDQVALDKYNMVTHENVSKFVQKLKSKITIKNKPHICRDGVPRVEAKVKFQLLPNHLQIRAKKYFNLAELFSHKFSISPELILAIIHTESYFNPLAVSSANAYGLMQLIPQYGARDAYQWVYGIDRIVTPEYLFIPGNNVELGSAYMAMLMKENFIDINDEAKRLYLAICAYNWGPGSVQRNILNRHATNQLTAIQLYQTLRSKSPDETSDYLNKVIDRIKLYERIFPKEAG